MSQRRTLEEKVAIVRLYSLYGNAEEVRRQWKHRFDTPPPERATILNANERFNETGTVDDRHHSGRPPTAVTMKNKEVVEQI
jgi:hypothetical protein